MQLLIEGFTKPFNTSTFTYFDIVCQENTILYSAILKVKVLGKVFMEMPVSSGTDNQSLR